jgi:hypothetical protein
VQGRGRRLPLRAWRAERAVTLLARKHRYRAQPFQLSGLFTLFLPGTDRLALLLAPRRAADGRAP